MSFTPGLPPVFSIIIPVYDEAETLRALLSELKGFSCPGGFEVIVVDGHPRGTTLGKLPDTDLIALRSKTGRAIQMNCGAAAARGEVLLFLHADTLLPPHAFHAILESLGGQNAVAGAFDLGIRSERRIFRVIEGMVYWRTRISKIPYGDQAIFLKRDVFGDLGGYREIPIMEDVDLMRRVKAGGYPIAIIPRRVLTSPRRWEKEGIVYCTLRNWLLVTLYLSGVPPVQLLRYYRIHRQDRTR